MPRLWIVEQTFVSLALGETEQDAIDAAGEALRMEEPEVYARPFDGALPWGWEGSTLVYHEGESDVSVDEAIELQRLSEPPARCEHTLELPLDHPK